MHFRTLDEIIDDLSKAVAWFESVGLATKETRLQAIYNYLFDQIHFPDPDATLPEYDHQSVISDAASFALIAAECSKLSPKLVPKKALKDARRGQLCPSLEDAQSNDSRNKFFELELAAHLSLAGMTPVEFDDIRIQFEDCRYIIECKRPFSDRGFENNLSKAYVQLARRLKDPNDRALVAIAVEKVLDIDGSIQSIDSSAEASALNRSQLDQLKPRIIANGTTTDVQIVGILFITRFLMHTKTAGTYAMNYLLHAMPFRYGTLDPVPETSRLHRLTETLQQKFKSMDTGFN